MTRPNPVFFYKRRELILFYDSPRGETGYIAVFRMQGRYVQEGVEPYYLETVHGGRTGLRDYLEEQAVLCSQNGYAPCEEEHLADSLRLPASFHSLPSMYAWAHTSTVRV